MHRIKPGGGQSRLLYIFWPEFMLLFPDPSMGPSGLPTQYQFDLGPDIVRHLTNGLLAVRTGLASLHRGQCPLFVRTVPHPSLNIYVRTEVIETIAPPSFVCASSGHGGHHHSCVQQSTSRWYRIALSEGKVSVEVNPTHLTAILLPVSKQHRL